MARSYNPFAFGGALAGLKIGHEKGRGKAFIQSLPEGTAADLPEGAAEVPKVPKVPKKDDNIAAPRFCFAGRDDEVAALSELLGAGGPIVVSGPRGVGRTQIVEHAIKQSGLIRLPDLWLGWGTAADALTARIATLSYINGNSKLTDLVKGAHNAAQINEAAVEALADPSLAGRVLVVHQLEYGLGRENDASSAAAGSRCCSSPCSPTPLALPVTLRLDPPAAVPHARARARRCGRLEVGGLAGRFLHPIFEAHKAAEFPREKFGPLNERNSTGTPWPRAPWPSRRASARTARPSSTIPKFMTAEGVHDLTPLSKQLSKRVEKLPDDLRRKLARLSHLRIPVDGAMLANELGITRKDRLELMSLGLLDIVGTEDDRRYRVHPLVKSQLAWREVSNFDVCERLADMFALPGPQGRGHRQARARAGAETASPSPGAP